MRHLITLVEDLRERGIGFRSLNEGAIDTTCALSELIFNIFSALAQFERRLIEERTKAGLAAAILAKDDASGANQHAAPAPNNALATNLARAGQWQEQLESGEFTTLEELAKANKVDRTYVGRILQLTSLSPKIVEPILAGNEPTGISLRQLRKGVPVVWSEQCKNLACW